jgi:hypothetical protein
MDPSSYNYKEDVKDTDAEEEPLVVPHVYVIAVNHFRYVYMDICKIRLARIFRGKLL